jgi:hypothetical protein
VTEAERRRWDGIDRRRPPILHVGARVVLHGRTWWVRKMTPAPDGRTMTLEVQEE